MAAITSNTESWNNHKFSEVETHIKGRLNSLETSIGDISGKTYKKLIF